MKMNWFKYALIHTLFFSVLLLFSSYSNANSVGSLPAWPQVGKVKLEVFWFDIYEAELRTPSGKYQAGGEKQLNITYLREFTATELVDETLNQWQDKVPDQQAKIWAEQLEKMWPNIKESDQLSFLVDQSQHGHFYYNSQYIGSIEDAGFSKYFADIWLANDSAYPKLAKKLKGQ
jgi:hypothetical protein